MTLANLPAPNFTGADLRDRLNAALVEARASRRFVTVAALLADTTLAYGPGARSIAAGDVVEAGGHRYTVAASAASDHDVTTAGGARLYVLPTPEGAMAAEAFGWLANNLPASATANTAAARAAIAGAFARGSGEVLLPSGTGYINGTLGLKRSTLLRGGNWLPSASPATLKLADGSNCDMVRTEFAAASYASATDTLFGGGVESLTLDGNRAGQSGANDPVTGQLPVAINAKHWILGSLKRIRVTSCVGYGIWWGGDVNTCTWEQVQSVRNGRSGVYVNNASVNTTVLACNFENNDDYGVEFGVMAADTNGMVFVGCAWPRFHG